MVNEMTLNIEAFMLLLLLLRRRRLLLLLLLQFFLNDQLDAQFLLCTIYVYFNFLHVSNSHVFIIRRVNCINMISGIHICNSMW